MKQLLVFLFLLCTMAVSAQDVIVKKDGSTVVCRVVELTESEIVYKKWSDLNGSNYVMERSAASAINYQNGKKVNLSETTNLYAPNNQNDGVQQYNDRALLALDETIHNPYKKVKTLRTIGWIGGGVLLVAGGLFFSSSGDDDWLIDDDQAPIFGGVCAGAAAIWTTSFLIAANAKKKKYENQMLYSTIYQHEFQFSNGSTLVLGADMINDRYLGQKTIGLGLHYNF